MGLPEKPDHQKEDLPSRRKTVSKLEGIYPGLGFNFSVRCDMAKNRAQTHRKVLLSLVWLKFENSSFIHIHMHACSIFPYIHKMKFFS